MNESVVTLGVDWAPDSVIDFVATERQRGHEEVTATLLFGADSTYTRHDGSCHC